MIDRRSFLLGVVLGAVLAGCGDASRRGSTAAAAGRQGRAGGRAGRADLRRVGRHAGRLHQRADPRARQRSPREPELQGGRARQGGDLLFQVDPRPYQTAVDQAEAHAPSAESQLSQARAQVSASQAQVEQALAKVVQDEAQVKKAEANQRRTELDVARYTPLAERGSVSQQELDNAVQNNLANLAAVAAARAAVQNSQASVSQARAALEKAQADVKTQEANIAAARAALAEAQLNLGYTRVLSPIAGMAGFRGANIGDYVGPNDPTPLTTVSQVDPIYAEFPISEQRALAVVPPLGRRPEGAPRHRAGADSRRRQRLSRPRARRRARPAGRRDDRHRARARRVPESRATCCVPASTRRSAPSSR